MATNLRHQRQQVLRVDGLELSHRDGTPVSAWLDGECRSSRQKPTRGDTSFSRREGAKCCACVSAVSGLARGAVFFAAFINQEAGFLQQEEVNGTFLSRFAFGRGVSGPLVLRYATARKRVMRRTNRRCGNFALFHPFSSGEGFLHRFDRRRGMFHRLSPVKPSMGFPPAVVCASSVCMNLVSIFPFWINANATATLLFYLYLLLFICLPVNLLWLSDAHSLRVDLAPQLLPACPPCL